MATITLDTQEIARLSKEGGKFAMNAESEVALARLLFIREKIDEFITEAKAEIEKSALDLDKDFTGLKGDKIKVEYRAFGAEYKIAEDPNLVPREFIKSKTMYSLVTSAIKEHQKNTGMLPIGVEAVERKKQISIKAIA